MKDMADDVNERERRIQGDVTGMRKAPERC